MITRYLSKWFNHHSTSPDLTADSTTWQRWDNALNRVMHIAVKADALKLRVDGWFTQFEAEQIVVAEALEDSGYLESLPGSMVQRLMDAVPNPPMITPNIRYFIISPKGREVAIKNNFYAPFVTTNRDGGETICS